MSPPDVPLEQPSIDFPRRQLLPSLLRIAETSLTVGDLASHDLWYIDPDWTVEKGLEEMSRADFDYAPVLESRPYRYVTQSELHDRSGSVHDVARIIDATHLVTSGLGLAQCIALLGELGFYFVLGDSGLSGIVTLADLQLPPVSMVTFALILAIEAGIDRLITGWIGDAWPDFLSPQQRAHTEDIFADRIRQNVAMKLLDCIFLPTRLRLLLKHPVLCAEFCLDAGEEYDALVGRLIATRNVLAHGGTLLGAESDPVQAIEWFNEIRRFAERLWAYPASPKDVESAEEMGTEPGLRASAPIPGQRREVVASRVNALTGDLARYVEAYDSLVPFSSEQLRVHRETIALRREAGSAAAAIDSDGFVTSLRSTLEAWGLGVRGSSLAGPSEFAHAIRASRSGIEALDGKCIDDPNLDSDTPERVWDVIAPLEIVSNKAKVVAGTKALHHLLPDLVVPMDRAWTGRFFQLHGPEWQDPASQRRVFLRAYRHFLEIARRADPNRYADGCGWRTSRTKIIDNALIGFCKLELSGPSS